MGGNHPASAWYYPQRVAPEPGQGGEDVTILPTLRGLCVGTALGLAGALAALPPTPAAAQKPSDGDIRVVEMVDPATGARYRQTVYDLTRMEIKKVQRALREAGYLGVGWTGQLDHGTVRALGEFQDDRSLYRCDCVSYETIVALGLKPIVELTTVAVGGSGQPGHDPYADYRAGIYYPFAVPVLVPVDSAHPGDHPDHPDEDAGDGVAPAPVHPYPPPGATPPGIRPLPPPTRVLPADPRSGTAAPPAP